MSLELHWQQIALRLLLALLASAAIGLNRDEHGKTAGLRTTMLVTLAATLAMLQTNLILPTAGKTAGSFVQLDAMRLPLGILSGIGFLGAGTIMRKDNGVHGLTTAATLWISTVLGLLYGGGQLRLGVAGSLLTIVILWLLKYVERRLPVERIGNLTLDFAPDGVETESSLRALLHANQYRIETWSATYDATGCLRHLAADLSWHMALRIEPGSEKIAAQLSSLHSVTTINFQS